MKGGQGDTSNRLQKISSHPRGEVTWKKKIAPRDPRASENMRAEATNKPKQHFTTPTLQPDDRPSSWVHLLDCYLQEISRNSLWSPFEEPHLSKAKKSLDKNQKKDPEDASHEILRRYGRTKKREIEEEHSPLGTSQFPDPPLRLIEMIIFTMASPFKGVFPFMAPPNRMLGTKKI